MNARTLITLAVPLASALWMASPDTALADTSRLELLAASGSSQAKSVPVHGRHGNDYRHDNRHDNRRGGHGRRNDHGRHRGGADYGHDRRGGHGGHGGYRDAYGHGHAIRERAHHYATTAIQQAEEARRLSFYSDHPRWGLNYHSHFQWALQARPHRVEEEIRRRARKLRELRSWGYGWNDHRHTPYCRH